MSETAPASFPIEEVARFPLPGTVIPGALAFSPDNRLVTYLFSPEGGLVRQLYAYDTETGQERLLVSPAESGAAQGDNAAPATPTLGLPEHQAVTGLSVTRGDVPGVLVDFRLFTSSPNVLAIFFTMCGWFSPMRFGNRF